MTDKLGQLLHVCVPEMRDDMSWHPKGPTVFCVADVLFMIRGVKRYFVSSLFIVDSNVIVYCFAYCFEFT